MQILFAINVVTFQSEQEKQIADTAWTNITVCNYKYLMR